MNFLDSLRDSRLIGILRGIEFDELSVLHDACCDSGLKFVEVTMNTPQAVEKIAELKRLSAGAYQVGAGTVLTEEQYRSAVTAGAEFIVSPVLVATVAQAAVAEQVPFLPGALTPQDVYNCHVAGATVVKVFPVGCFGPNYIRELRGPFNDIPLLACGGIRPDNVAAYLESGADGLALGSGTFKREWLKNKDRKALGESLRALTKLANTRR
jgi:2-dehydro-3-deoxyphosphogluconate aldolase/(4S)-4-hydroxy-2-oxoglutarate aldolase